MFIVTYGRYVAINIFLYKKKELLWKLSLLANSPETSDGIFGDSL